MERIVLKLTHVIDTTWAYNSDLQFFSLKLKLKLKSMSPNLENIGFSNSEAL